MPSLHGGPIVAVGVFIVIAVLLLHQNIGFDLPAVSAEAAEQATIAALAAEAAQSEGAEAEVAQPGGAEPVATERASESQSAAQRLPGLAPDALVLSVDGAMAQWCQVNDERIVQEFSKVRRRGNIGKYT